MPLVNDCDNLVEGEFVRNTTGAVLWCEEVNTDRMLTCIVADEMALVVSVMDAVALFLTPSGEFVLLSFGAWNGNVERAFRPGESIPPGGAVE
jgi:hypothetical protein